MVNRNDEYDDEEQQAETEEETQHPSKRRRSARLNNAGEPSSPSATPTPTKTGRRRDEVWKHAKQIGKSFKCNHCGNVYKGGAARIKAHLRLPGHKGGLAPCQNYPPPPPSPVRVTNDEVANVSSSERETQLADDLNSNPPSAPTPWVPESDDNHSIRVQSSPPCSEHDADPDVSLPDNSSSSPLRMQSIPGEPTSVGQTEVSQYVEMVKESWSNALISGCISGCSVKYHFKEKTYDDFPKSKEVIGYTMYSPKGVIFLNAEQMDAEVEKFKEAKTFVLFDVEQENELKNLTFLGSSSIIDDLDNVLCCPPPLILELLHRLSERCDWISDLLKDTKSAYEFLTRSEENPLDASKFEHPFSELQAIMQHKKKLEDFFSDRSETSRKKFWDEREELLIAIGPLIQILDLFDSFVPNIGYFYEAVKRAEKKIECQAELGKFKMFQEMFAELKGILINQIHVTTAYLNPSYTYNELNTMDKMDEEAREYLKDYLVRSEDYKAFEEELSKYSDKDSSLFTEEAIEKLKEKHPVKWWEEYGEPVPILRRCAIRLLSQPSNCLSHLSHKPKFEVFSFKDSDLSRLNHVMMEEFEQLNTSDLKPIDVSLVDEALV